LRGFSEEMRRRGLIPSTQLLSLDLQQPMPEIAQILKLPPEEQVYCLKRLRYVNGQPVAIVTSYLPARLFAGIENLDLEKISLYHLFEHHYKRKLQWAEEAICAKNATEEEGRALHTQPGSPLLFVKETTYDTKSIVIEYSISLLRADRYTAMVISLRKN
jgi:GntR family transcriptional regulator